MTKSFKQFSNGLLKSMSKPIKIKKECYKCGTLIPKYKGKYPDKCPWCNELLKINKVNEKPKLEKGNDNEFVQPEKGKSDGN